MNDLLDIKSFISLNSIEEAGKHHPLPSAGVGYRLNFFINSMAAPLFHIIMMNSGQDKPPLFHETL